MSEGDVIYKTVPDFSPEIHEYTLYLPDFTKGIYGLGVSSYSEPVLSTYVNHNGERESVNLNAYAKYGNYQAMDYIVDYGPGENPVQIHSKKRHKRLPGTCKTYSFSGISESSLSGNGICALQP